MASSVYTIETLLDIQLDLEIKFVFYVLKKKLFALSLTENTH